MAAKPRTHTMEAILEETVLSAPGSDAMTKRNEPEDSEGEVTICGVHDA